MSSEMKILHLDFIGTGGEEEYDFSLSGYNFHVRHTKLNRDFGRLKKLLLHHDEDGIALSGLSLNFLYEGKIYTHKHLNRLIEPIRRKALFSDGSIVRETLERYLILRATECLSYNFRDRRILILSALTRYSSAELLASYTNKLVIGDMLYGIRLGVPMLSINSLRNIAPTTLEMITRVPLSWFSPAARAYRRRLPKYQWYFFWAEVILGGMEYFFRYSPIALTDKLVLTDVHLKEDIDFLKERGVSTVVNLRPWLDGVRLSSSVLGVAVQKIFGVKDEKDNYEKMKDICLNFYVQQNFEPEIIHLKAERDVEPSLIEPPADIYFARQARVDEVNESGNRIHKFAFIVHPLTYEHLLRHPIIRKLDKVFPQSLVEFLAGRFSLVHLGNVRNVKSPTGAMAEGLIYAIPMTSKLILRSNPELTYRQILNACKLAKERGARIVGLGAYTSIVGDAGVTIAKRSPIPITTGNSFTVAVTLQTIKRSAELMGIELSSATVCVIGATGSIGRIICLMLGGLVRKLILSAPRSERLLSLSKTLKQRFPELVVQVSASPYLMARECLPEADIVVTTTSTVEPVVDISHIKPGSIVCDVARPPDVSEKSARKRPDVLVIESGEVQLPEGSSLTCDLGLPKNVIYACLAETILLALSGMFENFTVGREISEDKVHLISELGRLHNFKLAAIRSFGRELTEEDILKIRQRAKVGASV